MKRVIIGLVVAALVVGGVLVIAAQGNNNGEPIQPTQSSPDSARQNNQDGQVAAVVTITYDGSKFSPEHITVKSGDTVKFVNNSSQTPQVSSDPHPAHTDNSELNIGQIPAGESATARLTTKGSWGYHNHLQSAQTGRITVE